jgi:hypothetical protein
VSTPPYAPSPELIARIAAEAKELADVPKIPIQQFAGPMVRCQVCGKTVPQGSLEDINKHVTARGGMPRLACEGCRRNG